VRRLNSGSRSIGHVEGRSGERPRRDNDEDQPVQFVDDVLHVQVPVDGVPLAVTRRQKVSKLLTELRIDAQAIVDLSEGSSSFRSNAESVGSVDENLDGVADLPPVGDPIRVRALTRLTLARLAHGHSSPFPDRP